MPTAPRDPMEDGPKIKTAALSSRLVIMGWVDYVREVQAAKHHDVDDSLQLLRVAQKWFASVPSFADLSVGRRQAIAGLVVNKAERELQDEGLVDSSQRKSPTEGFRTGGFPRFPKVPSV